MTCQPKNAITASASMFRPAEDATRATSTATSSADGPPDPLRQPFAAREHFSTALGTLLGQAVYKPWHPADQIAFEGLRMPTSSEQHEADILILLLAKGAIDYLNVKALRRLPGVTDSKAQSINCLEAWVSSSGGDSDALIRPLRVLQGLRSTGPAHLRGKDWHATEVPPLRGSG
ncbi:hypothetical protein ABZ499_32640 [Streptomyces sp. NPDC019990]|uniref:hypothetical protein n=1 Tax=Streptomyces sp. NPDC019990 TaxID=3154693 RepID=UPI0033C9929F